MTPETLEDAWQSFFAEVLKKHGAIHEAALRNIFFAGAASIVALMETKSMGQLRVEVLEFYGALPGAPN